MKKLSAKYPESVSDLCSLFLWGLNKKHSIKKKMILAIQLLESAGYVFRDGIMHDPNGQPFNFTFLLASKGMERVVTPYIKNLRKMGIQANIEVKESSVYQKILQSREFDIIVLRVGQSQSPGNEQIDLWHSSTANVKYSRNHYGLSNKAVDELVEKIVYAKSRANLELYTRCLDRLLYHLHITVHNWHNKAHRVAIWNKFGRPSTFPQYYNPLSFVEFMWIDQAKNKNLIFKLLK